MSRTNKPIELTRIEKPAERLSDPVTLGEIRNDLPVYLFSRSEDPAGHQLEGVRLLIERYHKAGIYDIVDDCSRRPDCVNCGVE